MYVNLLALLNVKSLDSLEQLSDQKRIGKLGDDHFARKLFGSRPRILVPSMNQILDHISVKSGHVLHLQKHLAHSYPE